MQTPVSIQIGRRNFWFNEAYLLTDPNENNLLDLIKQDIIIVDVRMHLRENRVVRNHGTGFRIDERFGIYALVSGKN